MTWKRLNILIAVLLILGGASYAAAINRSAAQAIFFSSAGIGPAYFPNILAALLIGLSLIVLIRNIADRSAEKAARIVTENAGYILGTLALAVLAIALWQVTGFFYPVVFGLLAVLMSVFRAETGGRRAVVTGIVTAAGTTLFIYALFGRILQVSF
ncbi:tripartite tricarboxylate transporter TctB family protein [Falsirhodobacter algicola]|uniref:DUF1468 domain-containing protein n=1 Tax=Falsirhodobacter algicola TaxID=2692330 RepID=A0A8J8SME1_9RHOB|nr:tripartite tricarboxylate transporter TctB family protein [Falsirhodobacter algicola]QUS37334.1 hypothetical protein GR316_13220 [Falsirhodobacter algicola]